MSILSSIFNPTILVFLGFTLLIVALLIVYFENKMREQNHKISSMLSLVSSLAEETNAIKNHLNYMNNANTGNHYYESNNSAINNLQNNNYLDQTLISVSDNEDDDEDEDDDEEDDEEDDDDEDDDDEDDDDEDEEDKSEKKIKLGIVNQNDIKVLNLDNLDDNDFFTTNDTLEKNDDDDDHDNDEDNDDLEDIDFNKLSDSDSDNDSDDKKTHIKMQNNGTDNQIDFKTINISNLEETNKNMEVMDYKKLSLNKLKSIVVEKGLLADSSKLKKHELLKLLISE